MFIVALTAAWGAECDLRTYGQILQRFDAAFVSLDLTEFQSAIAEGNRTLACMTEPLTPVHCANAHRMRAFDAFVTDDLADATLHFQAVVATQPGYKLPEKVVPAGHPMQDVFEQAKQFSDDSTWDLAAPNTGWLTVDGRRSLAAPSGRPWVFQRFESDGTVAQTRYVEVGAPMPTYTSKSTKQKGKLGKTVLLVGGLGAVAVAGGVYGGALASRGSYNRAVVQGDRAAIDSSKATTNLLAITSFGLGGVGVAMVGVSFVL